MHRQRLAALRRLFSLSDEEAMSRVQKQNDPHAFALLVGRWEGPIQQLCARMSGDLHCGEDLAQETFARLFAHREQFRHNARFSTFLWRIALNLCYDHGRREKRRGEYEADCHHGKLFDGFGVLPTSEPVAHTRLVEQERAEIVQKAVKRLPESYRTVVVLRHYEGLKFREIAEVLAIPEGTVKSRMAEALTRLGRSLGPILDQRTAPTSDSETKQPSRKESP